MIQKKLSLFVLIILAAVAVFVMTAPAIHARSESFTETFENPQLPNWERSPEAVVTGGLLRIGPANFAACMGSWENFNLDVRLRYSGSGEALIQYRASDKGFYQLSIGESEILLFREKQGEGNTELARAAPVQLSAGQWIELGISLNGSAHSVTVNSAALFTADDPDPLAAGTVVFAAHGQRTVEIENVSLQVIGAAKPPEVKDGAGGEDKGAVPGAASRDSGALLSLLNILSGEQGSTFRIEVFVINMLLAVFASFVLSRAYIYWGRSLSNRRKFAATFMMITVTTTFIILVVRSSVALSLGLVGALSIIRFRAAIKEPEELAYLFLTIGLGIGLGDNQRVATLLALAVVIAVIGVSHLFRQTQADINLHLTVGGSDLDIQQVTDTLGKHCAKLRLLRYDQNNGVTEMTFVVEFRHSSDLNRVREELVKLDPSIEISFLDNKGVW